MKFVHWVSVVTAAFSIFASSCAQQPDLTSSDVVTSINGLTAMSSTLTGTVNSITVVNVIFQGPRVAQGIYGIVNAVQLVVTVGIQNKGTVFKDADCQTIVATLTTFVQIHQQLLSTIIGKHGLLSLFSFAEPVRVALQALEAVVDQTFLIIVDMCPTRKSEGMQQKSNLDATIMQAITVYS